MTIIQNLARLEKRQATYNNIEYHIKAYELERGVVKIYTDKKTSSVKN